MWWAVGLDGQRRRLSLSTIGAVSEGGDPYLASLRQRRLNRESGGDTGSYLWAPAVRALIPVRGVSVLADQAAGDFQQPQQLLEGGRRAQGSDAPTSPRQIRRGRVIVVAPSETARPTCAWVGRRSRDSAPGTVQGRVCVVRLLLPWWRRTRTSTRGSTPEEERSFQRLRKTSSDKTY